MIQTDAFCIRPLQDNRRDGRSCTSYWYMFFKLGIAGHTAGEKSGRIAPGSSLHRQPGSGHCVRHVSW
jgi:hypothetical protein